MRTFRLLGEFNLALINWQFTQLQTLKSTKYFCNSPRNMVPINLSGTQRDTRIFLILVFQMIFSSSQQLCPISTSDHNVVTFKPNTLFSGWSYNQLSEVAYYNFLKADYYNLNQHLHALYWNALIQYCFSVEDRWSEFRSN